MGRASAERPRILRPDATDEAFPEGFGAVLEPAAPLPSAVALDRLARSARARRLRSRHGAVVVPRAAFVEGLVEEVVRANQAPRSEEALAQRFGAETVARVQALVASGRLEEAQQLRARAVARGRLRWTGLGNESPNQTWLHSHPGLGAIEFLYGPSEVGLVACSRAHLREVARLPEEPRCTCGPRQLAYTRACEAFYAEHVEQGGFGDYVAAFDRIGRAAEPGPGPGDRGALARHAICVNRARQLRLGTRCLHIDTRVFAFVSIDERLLHARDVRAVDVRSEPACYRQGRLPAADGAESAPNSLPGMGRPSDQG